MTAAVPSRREAIVETLHGVPVADPYRWLEDGTAPEVKSWVAAQNALTDETLARVPEREALHERLTQLLAIGTISLPVVRRTRGGQLRLFFTRRSGPQDQPVLYVRDGLRGQDRTLVDPNRETSDGTTSLDWYDPSPDGSMLAYGTSQGGTEDSTLRVREVATSRDLPDRIERTRFASVAWSVDARSFFYTRYPRPGSVPAGEERYHRRIYQHRLAADPEEDPLIFGAGLAATDFPGCQLSPDGRWLLVTVSRGWNESTLHLADLRASERRFVRISPESGAHYQAVVRNDALYVLTNEAASRYRLFAVDLRHPERADWRLLLEEHPSDVLEAVQVIGKQVLVSYLQAGVARIERFDLRGRSHGHLAVPPLGSSDGVSGLPDGDEAFYTFESFAVPPQIRHVDLPSAKEQLWEAVEAPIDPNDYVVSQAVARSRDGTLIPYRSVRRKDLAPGVQPTLLYGYGGFNENITPRFSRANFAWLERGGVYVQATLRGGGELGESWHRAGQLENKQNTFDDFSSVARDLIARGVTDPAHLAVYGRSNGGLLVAAVITQHPELFRAAVAGVPLTDMLRYPRFLIAKLWVPEYGSPEDPREFRWLLAYSPYHRVALGRAYPALLVTTAESDTRVDPLHARKLVAAMQYASSADRAILLRTESRAGHGAGRPVSKQVAELTDIFAFLSAELGVSSGGPLPRGAALVQGATAPETR